MLLARLFSWLDRNLGHGPSLGLVSPAPASPAPRRDQALLSVDGAGQYLLCAGERLTLGHLRAGKAELGFLADVGALHAVLTRAESLQAGSGWHLAPLGDELVRVDGEPLARVGRRLVAGARVRLGENLELRYSLPDPASASALLELLHGAECAGARRVVLLAPGAGGRVRIGSAAAHHVRVPGLDLALELEWRGAELGVASDEPLRGAFEGRRGALPFPPLVRLAVNAAAARGSRPPFALSLEPIPSPAGGAAVRGGAAPYNPR
jgi:hypothetical protein